MDLFSSPAFSEHVSHLMQEWHVPGLAIAVVQDNTIASKGYGYAHVDRAGGKAVKSDTIFDIASVSKSTTAAAVALLVADERYPDVQWDTPVSKLLDDFVLAETEYTNGVTVEDLVSHRSGIPGHDLSYLSPRAHQPDTLESVTRNLRHLPLGAPIRSKWIYCNMGFTVLAYLVEKISGQKFEDFARTRIWTPLGMTSTNIQLKNAMEAGLEVAQPYKWDDDKYVPVEMQYAPEAVGAGLVVTTVEDYAKWVRALMNVEHPVSKEVYDDLTRPRAFANSDELEELPPHTSPDVYCAGLGSFWYRGYQVVAHDGGDPGVATTHFFLPQLRFGGVIFGNAEGARSVHTVLVRELIDAAMHVPTDERFDWHARERHMLAKDDEEEREKNEKRREELCPKSDGEAEPQVEPLESYIGSYWNDGYRRMNLQISGDGKLFIDASDRTMGFYLELEHLCGGTKYIAHMADYYEGNKTEIAAEFVFDGERVVRLGLELEDDVADGRIWFHKTTGDV